MQKLKPLPSLSVVIATLNSATVLDNCLSSIYQQKYDKKKLRVYICDGGSSDNTVKLAKKYGCTVLANPLKTAEAGKAVGIKTIDSDYVCFVDSDNILPHKHWLNDMIQPLQTHPQAVGSEPWEFTYRQRAGYIERYSSLIGANDPYALFCRHYDRIGVLHPWTNFKLESQNFSKYILFKLDNPSKIPTIGANGTVYRTSFIKPLVTVDYLFDVDTISLALKKHGAVEFIKTKNSIIHTYCENSLSKFIRKQIRRIKDLYTFNSRQEFTTKPFDIQNILFVIYSVAFFPALTYSLRGYVKKRDIAWLFHPFACLITAVIYSYLTILKLLQLIKPQSRQTWSQ